jgi:hypothetical protein
VETHGRQDVALQAPSADAETATQAQAEKADGEKTDLIISVLIPLGACPNSDSTQNILLFLAHFGLGVHFDRTPYIRRVVRTLPPCWTGPRPRGVLTQLAHMGVPFLALYLSLTFALKHAGQFSSDVC